MYGTAAVAFHIPNSRIRWNVQLVAFYVSIGKMALKENTADIVVILWRWIILRVARRDSHVV
jgi:hypothetical protein